MYLNLEQFDSKIFINFQKKRCLNFDDQNIKVDLIDKK